MTVMSRWPLYKGDRYNRFDCISITPPSFMKFCPVVPEICRGQVHGPRKERRKRRRIIITRYDYNLMIMKFPKPAIDTIYPHIKFWWYRTMLNFYHPFSCRVLAAILKMADILKILKTQNCSSNGDLSLCQILCLYHYPVRSYQH